MTIKITFEFETTQAACAFISALPDALPPSIVTGAAEVVPAAEPETKARKPRTAKTTTPVPAPQVTDDDREAVATQATVAPEPAPPVEAAAGPATQHAAIPAPVATLVTQPAAAAPTQADAQGAVERVFEAKGFQGAHQLLAQFGAARLRELDASKYAEFIAYADKMVA